MSAYDTLLRAMDRMGHHHVGPDAVGQSIVKEAMRLLLTDPNTPPMEILDQAMRLANGFTDFEWESTDPKNPSYVHPVYEREDHLPSPFGELLRRAFAPNLDPREVLIATLPASDDPDVNDRISVARANWDRYVRKPFWIRYGLKGVPHQPIEIARRPTTKAEKASYKRGAKSAKNRVDAGHSPFEEDSETGDEFYDLGCDETMELARQIGSLTIELEGLQRAYAEI